MGSSDVTGIDFSLTKLPAVKGQVTDSVSGTGIPMASVTVAPNPADSESPQTVTTDSSGNYVAYVAGSKTYSVAASKTRYVSSTPVNVSVAGSDVTQNIALVKNARCSAGRPEREHAVCRRAHQLAQRRFKGRIIR